MLYAKLTIVMMYGNFLFVDNGGNIIHFQVAFHWISQCFFKIYLQKHPNF